MFVAIGFRPAGPELALQVINPETGEFCRGLIVPRSQILGGCRETTADLI